MLSLLKGKELDLPQTPDLFEFWQYTNEGLVDGISGPADMNIWMKRNETP